MQRLISFDIDGTMVFGLPPGHVSLDMVRRAKSLGYVVGSASDRTISDQKELWKASNIEVDFVTLKHHLPQIKERFAVPHYMHVGDTDLDRHFATQAGFDFMWITEVPKDGSESWLLDLPAPRPAQPAPTYPRLGEATSTPIVIVDRPSLLFLGVQVEATEEDLPNLIPTAWSWIYDRQHELKHRYGSTFADVCLGGFQGQRRHIVGAEVTRVDTIPERMMVIGIPAHRYLFSRYQGPRHGIFDSFKDIYSWARERGLMTDGVKLDVGYLPNYQDSYHDLLVRVHLPDGSTTPAL